MGALIAFNSPLPDAQSGKGLYTKNTILAVVDIGGNSISLEVRRASKPKKKDPHLPPKFKAYCALAESIGKTGSISAEAKACAISTLTEIKSQIDALTASGHNVALKVIGTAPFRDADNGKAFAQEIREKTGLPLKVIKGKTEAKYAAKGVLSYFPDMSGIVVDTGGGSSEFAILKKGKIKDTFSLPLGMLRIASAEDAKTYIDEQLKHLPKKFEGQTTLITTGGINRALAKAYAKAEDKSLKKQDMVELGEYSKFTQGLANTPSDALSENFNIREERARQIQSATLLLNALQEKLGVEHVVLNKATMRDGIRAQMIKKLKKDAPLFVIPMQDILHREAEMQPALT